MQESKEYLKMKAEFEAKEPKRKPREMTVLDAAMVSAGKYFVANPDATVAPPFTGKKVKHVFIEATFPELKGGASRQSAHGEASGTKPAIARAFKNLLKTIPKKRITVISAKISITTKIVEDHNV